MCTYSKREIQRILRKNGYEVSRKSGSHWIYKNENGRHLSIKIENCNKMIFQRLIKEYDLVVN